MHTVPASLECLLYIAMHPTQKPHTMATTDVAVLMFLPPTHPYFVHSHTMQLLVLYVPLAFQLARICPR